MVERQINLEELVKQGCGSEGCRVPIKIPGDYRLEMVDGVLKIFHPDCPSRPKKAVHGGYHSSRACHGNCN